METSILESVISKEYTLNIAKTTDVVEAFYITKVVLHDFLKHSIIHKDLFISVFDKLLTNIENESLYIFKKKDVSMGMISFETSEPEEFRDISWESNGNPAFYVSRLFVLPAWRKMGIGKILLKFAEELAREKGFSTIKLDITSNFDDVNMLLTEQNYRFAGNIFYKNQRTPVNCYEKIIAL